MVSPFYQQRVYVDTSETTHAGECDRYSNGNDGTAHYSGPLQGSEVPRELRDRLGRQLNKESFGGSEFSLLLSSLGQEEHGKWWAYLSVEVQGRQFDIDDDSKPLSFHSNREAIIASSFVV